MSAFSAIRSFLHDESGAVAIEYALVAAGIASIVAVFFSADSGKFKDLLVALYAKVSSAANKTAAATGGGGRGTPVGGGSL